MIPVCLRKFAGRNVYPGPRRVKPFARRCCYWCCLMSTSPFSTARACRRLSDKFRRKSQNSILAEHLRLALCVSKQYPTSTGASDFANIPHLEMWGSIKLSHLSDEKCGDLDSLLLQKSSKSPEILLCSSTVRFQDRPRLDKSSGTVKRRRVRPAGLSRVYG